ncbi:MAG: hypothetical protein MUF81_11795 [Verrucomicrobia bacterium]|nr:hypothetical protein [Verrucomicrobiota bacterium]
MSHHAARVSTSNFPPPPPRPAPATNATVTAPCGALCCAACWGEDYRGLSRRLTECPLFRWFCGLEELAAVRVPGKSTLQDYAHWLPAETLRPLIEQLIRAAQPPAGAAVLELAHSLELDTVRLGTTCLKTNIHFSVDWGLLSDAVRTLMKATRLIGTHGLKPRMAAPESFIHAMNRLSL